MIAPRPGLLWKTVLASLAWLLALATNSRADEVRLIPNSTVKAPGGLIRGTIEKESPNDVLINGQTIPLDQIAEVEYDNAGTSFTQARLQWNNGNFAQAADLYQKATTEASGKPLVVQTARFLRARALAQLAQSEPDKKSEALKEVESTATALARTRHAAPALELLAELQMSNQDFKAAEQTLQKLAQIPWATRRAGVLQGRLQSRSGNYEQALASVERLIQSTPEGSSERRDAELARAEALAGLKRFADAEQAARTVIDTADPEDGDSLASAYNTLGDCLQAAGRDRDALFAYLHTDILYAQADPDAHARALSAITRLWRKLDQAARADQTLARLKQEYPSSRYLAEASQP